MSARASRSAASARSCCAAVAFNAKASTSTPAEEEEEDAARGVSDTFSSGRQPLSCDWESAVSCVRLERARQSPVEESIEGVRTHHLLLHRQLQASPTLLLLRLHLQPFRLGAPQRPRQLLHPLALHLGAPLPHARRRRRGAALAVVAAGIPGLHQVDLWCMCMCGWQRAEIRSMRQYDGLQHAMHQLLLAYLEPDIASGSACRLLLPLLLDAAEGEAGGALVVQAHIPHQGQQDLLLLFLLLLQRGCVHLHQCCCCRRHWLVLWVCVWVWCVLDVSVCVCCTLTPKQEHAAKREVPCAERECRRRQRESREQQ